MARKKKPLSPFGKVIVSIGIIIGIAMSLPVWIQVSRANDQNKEQVMKLKALEESKSRDIEETTRTGSKAAREEAARRDGYRKRDEKEIL